VKKNETVLMKEEGEMKGGEEEERETKTDCREMKEKTPFITGHH